MAMAPVPFLVPFFLVDGLKSSASTMGVIMALIATPSVIVGPLSGWISDKIGTLKPQAFSLILAAIGLFSFRFLDIHSSILHVSASVILFGTGMGVFFPSNNSAVAGSVSRETLATAMGLASTLRMLGSATGVAIAGTVFAGRQLYYQTKLIEQGMDQSLVERASVVQSFQFVLSLGIVLIMFGLIMIMLYSLKKRKEVLL
jgi:MFS family permease